MERKEAEIEWISDDDIRLEQILVNGDVSGDVRVWADDGRECVLALRCEPGTDGPSVLRFDGRYVDVGDDLPRFLGIMDAAAKGVTFIGDCFAPGHPVPEPWYPGEHDSSYGPLS